MSPKSSSAPEIRAATAPLSHPNVAASPTMYVRNPTAPMDIKIRSRRTRNSSCACSNEGGGGADWVSEGGKTRRGGGRVRGL